MAPADDRLRRESLGRAVREGESYSVMAGAGETYFTAYALLLRATTSQIAFLAAVPALLGSFMQLVSAWMGHGAHARKPLIVVGVVAQGLMWAPMIWLPFWFPAHAMTIFIVCVVLYYAAANFASPGWNSWLGDLVPEDQRGRYFGHRSRHMNLANFVGLAVSGLVLNYWQAEAAPRVGFSIMFTFAMAARLYSAYQVHRMWEPQPPAADVHTQTLRHLFFGLRQSPFLRFSLYQATMNLSAGIAGPFFAVYMLRDLGFSYLQFMTSTAIVVLAQFMSLRMWGRIGDKFGNRVILAATGFLVPILPVLWLVSTQFWYIVAIQILGGLAWAGFNLSASNFVYDTVVPARRSTYGAIHNTLGAVAMFIGTGIGGYLGIHLPASATLFDVQIEFVSGLCWLFLLSTVARFATSLWFIPALREVRNVPPLSARELLWRLCGAQAIAKVFLNRS